MKKTLKFGFTALLFAFAFTALTGFGAIKASAGTLKADLDGDGTEETIEWNIEEPAEDEGGYKNTLTPLKINGKDVYKATKTKPIQNFEFKVFVLDTATKDNFKEVVVESSVDDWSEYYFFRYNAGKITKYAYIDDAYSILSGKTKNRIKALDYWYVEGIGNIFAEYEYKVKSGKVTLATTTFTADKENNYNLTFKSIRKKTMYKDTDWEEEAGTLKKGEKFTLIKFKKMDNGITAIYIKNKKTGVKGWINTEDCDYDNYLIDKSKAPLFG